MSRSVSLEDSIMAHQIDSIAYAGSTPWHKLGIRLTGDQRTDVGAAIAAAGLGWDVAAQPLFYTRADGSYATADDSQGIIRTDTGRFLGTVGSDYTPIQNRDTLSLLEPLVDRGCTVEVMAGLDGGRRVFGLIRMPQTTITVDGAGDDVNGYILVQSSHDGTSALRAMLTPIRVVCQNTLTMANSRAHSTAVSIRHTKSSAERVKQAAGLLDRMGEAFQATGETFAQLAARELGPKDIAEYIERAVPGPIDDATGLVSPTVRARRETIADLVFSGRGHRADAMSGRASAWYAYNAVVEYFDHVRAAEAKSQAGRASAWDSAIFGGNAAIKANAFELARQLVAA
jgi:phage/plasmid-like protein (TIGR03299 family)